MSVTKKFVVKYGLDNNSNPITNIADPTNAQDAATKNFSTNATNITSGTVPTARLGTGTGSATNFLRGDGTWSDQTQTVLTYPSIRPTLNLDFLYNKTLDPRVNFSRSTTAMYYDGKTTSKAEDNQVSYSQDFSQSSWVKGNVTATGGFVAPDGTSTATSIITSAVTSQIYLSQNTLNTGQTMSVYLKYNGNQYVSVNPNDNGRNANFDLVNNVISASTGVTASMTSVGNGWYRCVITTNSTAFNGVYIWPLGTTSASAVGNGTTGVYVWGAQLENNSSATAYTPTTASIITNYIPTLMTAPINVPRFDCDPVTGKSLGLLIEESRTNLLGYSQDFTNVAWPKVNSTIIPTYIIAPNGTLTGQKYINNSGSATTLIAQTVTFAATSNNTFSVYAKAGEVNQFYLQFSSVYVAGGPAAFFNLSTGTVGSVTAGFTAAIVPVGNGWYKCSISGTTTISVPTACNVFIANNSFTGNGYSGFYIWGAQVEQGTSATSYIPTTTTAITRTADSASINVSNAITFDSFSAYAEYDQLKRSQGYQQIFCFSDNVVDNNYYAGYYWGQTQTDNRIFGITRDVVGPTESNLLATSSSIYKTACSISTGVGDTICVDGVSFTTAKPTTNLLIYNKITTAYLLTTGASYLRSIGSGYIKKFVLYPTALSSSELQGLTS